MATYCINNSLKNMCFGLWEAISCFLQLTIFKKIWFTIFSTVRQQNIIRKLNMGNCGLSFRSWESQRDIARISKRSGRVASLLCTYTFIRQHTMAYSWRWCINIYLPRVNPFSLAFAHWTDFHFMKWNLEDINKSRILENTHNFR